MATFDLALTSDVLPSIAVYFPTISLICISIPSSVCLAPGTDRIPFFFVLASAFALCFSRSTNFFLSAGSSTLASIWVSNIASFCLCFSCEALALSFSISISTIATSTSSIWSITSKKSRSLKGSPFILYFALFLSSVGTVVIPVIAKAFSAIPSVSISPMSNSCPPANWPPVSLATPPPIAIVVPVVPIVALVATPFFHMLLTVPLVRPAVAKSINPIDKPLLADLLAIISALVPVISKALNLGSLYVVTSSFFKNASMFSGVKSLPSACSCSFINSVKVNPCSIEPDIVPNTLDINAVGTVTSSSGKPTCGPSWPAAKAVPAAAVPATTALLATSSPCNVELSMLAADPTLVCIINSGAAPIPINQAVTPPYFSLFSSYTFW